MSWSVGGAFGKAPSVRAVIAKQFEQGGKCSEPEETIRQYVAEIIDAALAAQGPNQVVEVSASGSQSMTYMLGQGGIRKLGELAWALRVKPTEISANGTVTINMVNIAARFNFIE